MSSNLRKRKIDQISKREDKIVPIMIDFLFTKALISENYIESYTTHNIVEAANLIYESFYGEDTVTVDGGIEITILGTAEGTIFDGESEVKINLLIMKDKVNEDGSKVDLIIGENVIKDWESKNYRSLYQSFLGVSG